MMGWLSSRKSSTGSTNPRPTKVFQTRLTRTREKYLLRGSVMWAAFASHATKASARAAVNTSPEPFSNIILSSVEDVATGGLLVLAFANPVAAMLIALTLLALAIWGLWAGYRAFRRLFPKPVAQQEKQAPPQE